MEIKTFDISRLQEAKNVLKDAFYREDSDPVYNEWEFAEHVLDSSGYVPELCLLAYEEKEAVGYNILTAAKVGNREGLALGPLGVKTGKQNRGVGTGLVRESVERAKRLGAPWIVVLGGDYYSRFGFENCRAFSITVSENDFVNDHLQILFLDESARKTTSGKLTYCSAFYDAQGNLL